MRIPRPPRLTLGDALLIVGLVVLYLVVRFG